MTFASVFAAVGSVLGLLGFAVLVAAAALALVADLTTGELGDVHRDEARS